jgi:DNA-binding beta-propeller fold protein YncE
MTTVASSSSTDYILDPAWPSAPDEWRYRDVSGIAVRGDRVYALCPDDQRIVILTRDGNTVGSWGLRETATTGLGGMPYNPSDESEPPMRSYPHSLAVCHDESVLCVDNRLNTIRKFSPEGELLATIGTPGYAAPSGSTGDFRSVTRGAPPFNGPAGVAEAPDGDIYVSDGYRNARVHCFSPEGVLKFSWGEPGDGVNQFRLPHALAITPDGERVVVADRENNRLVFFDRTGRFLTERLGFTRPVALQFDTAGYLYLLELGVYATVWDFLPPDGPNFPPSRCSVLTPSGEVVERWGSRDPEIAGTFFAPHCIAVAADGALFVGETNRAIEAGRGMPPTNVRTVHKFVRRCSRETKSVTRQSTDSLAAEEIRRPQRIKIKIFSRPTGLSWRARLPCSLDAPRRGRRGPGGRRPRLGWSAEKIITLDGRCAVLADRAQEAVHCADVQELALATARLDERGGEEFIIDYAVCPGDPGHAPSWAATTPRQNARNSSLWNYLLA